MYGIFSHSLAGNRLRPYPFVFLVQILLNHGVNILTIIVLKISLFFIPSSNRKISSFFHSLLHGHQSRVDSIMNNKAKSSLMPSKGQQYKERQKASLKVWPNFYDTPDTDPDMSCCSKFHCSPCHSVIIQ